MNKVKTLILLFVLQTLLSCGASKKSIYWVSGIKSECTGIARMECLRVHKGADFKVPKWKLFYSQIEGFNFEEGILKKIEVKEEKLKNVPADASSIKYTLIKELERQVDKVGLLAGEWRLSHLNGHIIKKTTRKPTMNFDIHKRSINGTTSCNNYNVSINQLTFNNIDFEDVRTTKMACLVDNVEREFIDALQVVKSYDYENMNLIFFDSKGSIVMKFSKDNGSADVRLHDLWVTTKMHALPISKGLTKPRLEINLTDMRIFGNDSCNEFHGTIASVSEFNISIDKIIGTSKKVCLESKLVNDFHEILGKVAAYKLVDGRTRSPLQLILLDRNGVELLALNKGD